MRLLAVPGLPREDTVTAAKDRGQLLGELRALVGRQQDDRRELAEVRTHELQLVSRIERRRAQIDGTLDELIDWQALHAMETLA